MHGRYLIQRVFFFNGYKNGELFTLHQPGCSQSLISPMVQKSKQVRLIYTSEPLTCLTYSRFKKHISLNRLDFLPWPVLGPIVQGYVWMRKETSGRRVWFEWQEPLTDQSNWVENVGYALLRPTASPDGWSMLAWDQRAATYGITFQVQSHWRKLYKW